MKHSGSKTSVSPGVRISWRRPTTDFEHYLRTEAHPAERKFARYWLKWSAVLGLGSIAALWFLNPAEALRALWPILGLLTILPLAIRFPSGVERWLHTRWPDEYEIDDEGLRTIGGVKFLWSRVEGVSIDDHPEVAGLRRITARLRGFGQPRSLAFDPAEVDEESLFRLIANQVNSQILVRPASCEEVSVLLLPAVSSGSDSELLHTVE
jgi:hypothetical protein